MSKKIIPILTGIFLFFGCNIAQANVIINEVQLNPTEERFIELYNPGNSAINLTDWYIQRKTQTGSSFGSLVSKTYFENKTIEADSYFLISKSAMNNADIVFSNLTLTESNTIQIKNSDQGVVDKVGWGNASDCDGTCAPNPVAGESIQKVGNDWIVASPTPRMGNDTSQNNENEEINNDETNDNVDTSGDSSDSGDEAEDIKILPVNKIKIIAKTPAFVGVPTEFKVSNTVSNDSCGKYFWNFGDGNFEETKEMISIPQKLTHIYSYEGEYIVTLECYKSYLSTESDSSSEITIKVVPSDISISKVGDAKDFFVEISNNTGYNANLSKWVLSSSGRSFVFPKNTIIQSKKKIILSPKITGFSISDKDNLRLVNSEGETVFTYSSFSKSTKTLTNNSTSIKTSSMTGNENKNLSEDNSDMEMPIDDLGAEAIKSSVLSGKNLMYGMGLFAFLGISASAVYSIRNRNRKPDSSTPGSDFEIMDE